MNKEQIGDWLWQFSLNKIFKPKPLIMGVLNITPDSFSDAGLYNTLDKARQHALTLIAQGVDIIDIGGESSRPNAKAVSLDEELERVIPIIQAIREHSDIAISIDTYKPKVMKAAVNNGATLINDIYALQQDGALEMASSLQVPVCIMHMQGEPKNMQLAPSYPQGLHTDLRNFFSTRINACLEVGIKKSNIIIDPGFGFGKTVQHNLQLMHFLQDLQEFNLPTLIGVSRKSTIGALLNQAVDERLIGGITLAIYAVLKGINIIRTHDVDETKQALTMLNRIEEGNNGRT